MSRYLLFFLWVFLWTGLLQGPASGTQPGEVDPKDATGARAPTISWSVQSTPLEDVLEGIRERHGIEVLGLEGRSGEAVTFSFEGDVQEEIVRFLAYLGEKNYAFLFAHERLSRVQVVPRGGGPLAGVLPEREQQEPAPETQARVLGVRVQEVVKGSQAERADILAGDVIAKYDGTPIARTQDLIELVKGKPSYEAVEIVLLREGQPVRIFLDGGFIGIKITDSQIQANEMEGYRLWGTP